MSELRRNSKNIYKLQDQSFIIPNMFTWKIKPAARITCTGTMTERLKACKLENISAKGAR